MGMDEVHHGRCVRDKTNQLRTCGLGEIWETIQQGKIGAGEVGEKSQGHQGSCGSRSWCMCLMEGKTWPGKGPGFGDGDVIGCPGRGSFPPAVSRSKLAEVPS